MAIVSLAIAMGSSAMAFSAQADSQSPQVVQPQNEKTPALLPHIRLPGAEARKAKKEDARITREIRNNIVSDKALIGYAHNIEIYAKDGKVTLKGHVHCEADKASVEDKATEIAGSDNVDSQIVVKGT